MPVSQVDQRRIRSAGQEHPPVRIPLLDSGAVVSRRATRLVVCAFSTSTIRLMTVSEYLLVAQSGYVITPGFGGACRS